MTPIVIERFNDDDGDQKGDMMVQILQLDVRGMPQEWITPEDAATYYATDSRGVDGRLGHPHFAWWN